MSLNAALGNAHILLEQFATNAFGTPQRILTRYASDALHHPPWQRASSTLLLGL
jgi:hypothetical protein